MDMLKKVRKAIIPAAGFGTRFLPATKAQPKEMLPVVDKPIIQYVVEDAVKAGVEDIIIVSGWHKRNIEDHFDYPFELEQRLEQAGKHEELEEIRRISNLANFYFLRQKGPMGNATPIWNARNIIGDEPFLVLFGDDFIEASPSRSEQLVTAYEEVGGSAILGGIAAFKPEDYKRYGYAAGSQVQDGILKIEKVIEKPGTPLEGQHYAAVSGSLYDPEIFNAIEESMKRLKNGTMTGENGYIDAVNILLERGKLCYAAEIKNGHYYDCGNKLEYLKAVVEFGLKHQELNAEFSEYLKHLPL
jgi:UTP--glucose-1-phosphate uridylyltransferase